MEFPQKLIRGVLLRRYKRFLADVLVENQTVTAHCANTGAMLGCDQPGMEVWLSAANNPNRKLPYTWEMVRTQNSLVGINTHWANKLMGEALETGRIEALRSYARWRAEVKCGDSRLDFLLENQESSCFLEVKSVTAAEGGTAIFPDAVTQRGAKHLQALWHLQQQGHRCVLFFCIQRQDVTAVRPADHIDPAYGKLLRQVEEAGVELLAYTCRLSPEAITISTPVPVIL